MADSDLTDRLSKLRGSQQPKLPLNELQERVAKLKGMDPAQYSAPPITVYKSPDRRSEHEKVDDLLAHLMAESHVDQQVGAGGRRMSDAEMEERLQRLKGDRKSQLDEYHEMDYEQETERIVRKAIAEAQLPLTNQSATEDEKEEEDMIWCVICNDDAKVCCQDCDNDLYCADCFHEFHSDTDSRKHKTRML